MRKLVIAALATLFLTPGLAAAQTGSNVGVGVGIGVGIKAGAQPADTNAAIESALVAHRAVYDLTLKDASERSGISDMSGRMVYEFEGSACEGYTVGFRFVTEIATGETTRITDQQTTTFEDVRNKMFRFVTRSFVNHNLDHEVRGSATEVGNTLKINLEQPNKTKLDIPFAYFPTEHMIEMIKMARAGKRFYQSRIYDGSDEADRAMLTTTIIGKKQTAKPGDDEAKQASALAKQSYWPISMAYFEETAKGDEEPTYTISFKLYENGVTRDLIMDYGDFVLEGKLSQLDLYKPATCAKP